MVTMRVRVRVRVRERERERERRVWINNKPTVTLVQFNKPKDERGGQTGDETDKTDRHKD